MDDLESKASTDAADIHTPIVIMHDVDDFGMHSFRNST
jgi:hypothetical protein